MRYPDIKLYGAERCHKTQYYIDYFRENNIPIIFLDVEINEENAEGLRNLYGSQKLNFPTITIGDNRLRNPSTKEIEKWLTKIKEQMKKDTSALIHDEKRRQFRLPVGNAIGVVRYERRNDTFFLIHAEVPFEWRGRGYGKTLVETTLEYIDQHGWKAEAVCPFIKVVVRRSEKWSKLFAA